ANYVPWKFRLDALRDPASTSLIDKAGLHGVVEQVGAFPVDRNVGKAMAAKVDLHTQDGALTAQLGDRLDVMHGFALAPKPHQRHGALDVEAVEQRHRR